MIKPKAVPIEYKFRVREEKNGILSILPKGNYMERQVHFLNPSAVEILQQCDGKKTIEEITSYMQKEYPDVESEVIANDVNECLDSLKDLGLLEEGSVQTELTSVNGFCVRIAQEKDFKRISKYLIPFLDEPENRKSLDLSYLPVPYVSYYPAVAIRSRQFHSKEIFYIAENEGEIVGVTSLAAIGMPLRSTQVGLFTVNSDVPGGGEKVANDMFDTISEAAHKFGFLKLKCGLNNEDNEMKLKDFISGRGFNIEATLENELGIDRHIYIYTLFLNGKG